VAVQGDVVHERCIGDEGEVMMKATQNREKSKAEEKGPEWVALLCALARE